MNVRLLPNPFPATMQDQARVEAPQSCRPPQLPMLVMILFICMSILTLLPLLGRTKLLSEVLSSIEAALQV